MRITIIFLFSICLFIGGCSEDQHEVDLLLIQEYLVDNNLTAQSTASGLHYIINNPGTGGSPHPLAEVDVLYEGMLLDGTVFDQTTGAFRTFDLPFLIQGWQEGIPLLQKGGNGTFLIPSNLGYGSNPPPGIPKNAVLIFDITLVNWN